MYKKITVILCILCSATPVLAARTSAVPAQVVADYLDSFTLETAVPAAPAVPVKPVAPVPQWHATLGDIQSTAAGLLDTNKDLLAEQYEIGQQRATLEVAVRGQRVRNQELLRKSEERKKEILAGGPVADIKAAIERAHQEEALAKESLNNLQSRMKLMENRITLRELKLKDMELEQRSLVLDRKARGGEGERHLQSQIQQLKNQIAEQKSQSDFISKKMSEVAALDRPDIKEARSVTAENIQLRKKLEQAAVLKENLALRINAAREDQNSLEKRETMSRFRDLTARKMLLEKRVAEADLRGRHLTTKVEADAGAVLALGARIKELEKENKELDQTLGNVRENIAVLEYGINTLTRYGKKKR